MLKYYSHTIVFQEIPDEVSLCFEITGCPLRCPGCHSPHLRNGKLGTDLTIQKYLEFLDTYKDFITCVLFMGGEWEEEDLILRLLIAKDRGLKTGLYSGLNEISSERLLDCLDYLKIGPYKKELGGLQNKETTNQVLYNLNTGEKINVHDSF